jgi:hypothetical protein
MQPNEASSSPPEAVLSPEISSLDRYTSNRLVHGPSPSASHLNADLSVGPALGGFDHFFPLPGSSTDPSSFTRSTPDTQSLASANQSSPATSFTTGNSGAPWTTLPPLSLFSSNAIIPKSGSEVTQFGSWYVFPQRQSPTGSGARGLNGEIIDLSNNNDSDNNQLDPPHESYLLDNDTMAAQLASDLLSPERSVYNAECRVIHGKHGQPLHPSDKF